MSLLAWIALGAIAGYVAGYLVGGEGSIGVVGHIALGIVGGLVGGYATAVLLSVPDPVEGPLDISTIVVAVVGAIFVVTIARAVSTLSQAGGPV